MKNEPFGPADSYAAALALAALGYSIVPLAYGTKRPLVPWRSLPTSTRDINAWFERFGSPLNLAIHAGRSGVIVLDADTEGAERWVEQHCPETPMRSRTLRGGMHYYFGTPARPPPPAVNLFGLGLDVRAGPSLIVVDPSRSQKRGNGWRWIGPVRTPAALPIIDSSLIRREPLPEPKFETRDRARPVGIGAIRDVTGWIMSVESIEGSYGSNACFKVACRLVDAGFPWDQAWEWLCRWNRSGRARPPWSEAELRHKLRDAFVRSRKETRWKCARSPGRAAR